MRRPSICTTESSPYRYQTGDTAQVQILSSCTRRGNLSWIKQIVSGVALTGLTLGLLTSGKAEAISFTFERVVDTNTAIPEGTGTFDRFDPPVLDNGNVAFGGASADFEQVGIYTSIGGELNVVADLNTPIPGGVGNFAVLFDPSLDNGNVAFLGFNADFESGVYTNTGGELDVVANTNTPIPSGIGDFGAVNPPSLDNGSVAFAGFNADFEPVGIYTNIGGGLNVVADRNTPIPDDIEGNFVGFGDPSLDNGNVAFLGSGDLDGDGFEDQQGIYTNIDGVLDVVANRNTPIPGGIGNFEFLGDFGTLSLDNGNVAFGGGSFDTETGLQQQGIYTNIGGELSLIADTNTPIPDGIGNFGDFLFLSLDNGNVAFLGENAGFEQVGIYTNIGGTLAEVIAVGDLLDGKEVGDFSPFDVGAGSGFGREGLSGNQIVFTAAFDDGSQAIYVATAVPEPSSVLGTLAFGAFGGGWMLRRKLRRQKLASRAKRVE